MTLGTKLAVIFVALGLAPLLALSALNYRSGVGAVEGLLRERASERASRVGRKAVRILDAQESRLVRLSHSDSLESYARVAGHPAAGVPGASAQPFPPAPSSSSPVATT
ncbi:MAG TPA: hypothetical protein VKB12_13505, partial [Pyrinomonadaceae bacterium]|nr:hypothetical protein [Pyrinomonadaceae bacterium]